MDSNEQLPPCREEIYKNGVSACLVGDVPKFAAEKICESLSAVTGWGIDWHYIGGRVHIKALPPDQSSMNIVTAERDALQLRLNAVEEENDRLRNNEHLEVAGYEGSSGLYYSRLAAVANGEQSVEPVYRVKK